MQGNAAKFAFIYLLSLVALIFTAISSGMIIFQIINKFIPDASLQYQALYASSAMRFGISALVIASPIYFLMSRQIQKYLFSGEMPKDALIRKWLTYFIMLVTSVVMIGWLIGILNNFLNGDLTGKFMLKAATALGISAIIFSFYIYDMRREVTEAHKDKNIALFAYGAIALVSFVFISSLFVVESPAEVRGMRFDNAVLEDFSQIRSGIETYYQSEKKLPDNFEQLRKDFNFINDDTLKDPENGAAYTYKKLDDKRYELCANFRYSNKEQKNADFDYLKSEWPHDAGQQCISQKVSELGSIINEKMMLP
jgi:hypothetical protein